ncbi:MAG: peptide chain release factor 2 [Candidatus Omnitrophica bacterium]|nr:peptide chain release factor 2 [Candidatus Omnitrophota bacterium]
MLKEIDTRLSSIKSYLELLRGYLEIEVKLKRIQEISSQMLLPGFWDNPDSTNLVKELKSLKATVEPWQTILEKYQELKELAEVLDGKDRDLIVYLEKEIDSLFLQLKELESKTLLNQEFDKNNAILSINAGAGGTESCDWVSMLLRMYHRWAERHGYRVKIIDMLVGEEAGIKNVTILVEGEYAYGYLKAERGVHRLVRISPFDANKRRHTSFASVDVIPQLPEEQQVNIDEKDLRIDVYRSSGPGGQSVNTTDSAVRITHIPTGIVVQCQNERSQYQNKQTALSILKAKLFELERQKKEEMLLKQYGGPKKKIEWGSQIRSYIMHPYNLVKDHRTDYQTSEVDKIMDGEIDGFIESYLKSQKRTLRC